jgi:hypothetical protein
MRMESQVENRVVENDLSFLTKLNSLRIAIFFESMADVLKCEQKMQ